MACYKLRHIPTGLYFIPSRKLEVWLEDRDGAKRPRSVKSNLSKTGRIYQKRPSLSWVEGGYYTHFVHSMSELDRLGQAKLVTPAPGEWVIEEV